ncbi:MAG: hypothetical protein ACT4PT_13245 [Methanobacteriota archaeon]
MKTPLLLSGEEVRLAFHPTPLAFVPLYLWSLLTAAWGLATRGLFLLDRYDALAETLGPGAPVFSGLVVAAVPLLVGALFFRFTRRPGWLALPVLGVAAGLAVAAAASEIARAAPLVLLASGVAGLVLSETTRRSRATFVTTVRVVRRRGMISAVEEAHRLADVRAEKADPGLGGKVLDWGALVLELRGRDEPVRIPGVRPLERVQRVVKALAEEAPERPEGKALHRVEEILSRGERLEAQEKR